MSSPPNSVRFINPPIVEAIIAVTITQLPDDSLQKLLEISEGVAALGYALKTTMTSHEMELAIQDGVSKASNHDQVNGYQFISSDQRFAFQVLKTGMIFSQLGRYESWELFTQEAQKIWKIYLGHIGAVELQEFVVRYINKILVPLGEPSERYIKLYIEVPQELPQVVMNPYLRLSFIIAEPAGTLVHQQGLLPKEVEGFVSTLLDNTFTFPIAGLGLDELWPKIDSVREIKDHFFLNMLTDKMKESFNA